MTDLDFTAGPINAWFLNHAFEILPVTIVSRAQRKDVDGSSYPVMVASSGLDYYPDELYTSREEVEQTALRELHKTEQSLITRLSLCRARIEAIKRLQGE